MRNTSIKTVGTFLFQRLCYVYTKVALKTIIPFICMRKNIENYGRMDTLSSGVKTARQRNAGLKPPHINQIDG